MRVCGVFSYSFPISTVWSVRGGEQGKEEGAGEQLAPEESPVFPLLADETALTRSHRAPGRRAKEVIWAFPSPRIRLLALQAVGARAEFAFVFGGLASPVDQLEGPSAEGSGGTEEEISQVSSTEASMARPAVTGGTWLSKKYQKALLGGLVAVSALLALDYLRWHRFAMWLPSSIQSREFLDWYVDWDSVRVQTVVTHLKARTPSPDAQARNHYVLSVCVL